ncbi:hypothetical protein Tco_0311715 [Tanacetum coccineum]
MTDTQTSSFESPLKVDKDWKEKFFYPANHVESVEGCGSNTSKNVSEVEPKKVRKNNDAPIIEDWVSDDEEQEFAQEDGSKTKPEKKTVIPTAAKIEKPVRKPVKYAEMYMSQRPRGNQRNWNGSKINQLGCLLITVRFKTLRVDNVTFGGGALWEAEYLLQSNEDNHEEANEACLAAVGSQKLEYEYVVMNPTSLVHGCNTDVLKFCILTRVVCNCTSVLVTRASPKQQPVITQARFIIESCNVTYRQKLFEVDSGRISIRHCEY